MSSAMERPPAKPYQTECQISPKELITLKNSNVAVDEGETNEGERDQSKIDVIDQDSFDEKLHEQLSSMPIALALGSVQPPFHRSTTKSRTA